MHSVRAAHDFGPALEAKVAGFSRLLRGHGFAVGLSETQDAARIAELWMCVDFAAFQAGLRSLMCVSAEQLPAFDRLFQDYWAPADATRRVDPERRSRGTIPLPASQGVPGEGTDETQLEPAEYAPRGASSVEVLRRLDFSQVAAQDRRQLERLADRLWRSLTLERPRRLRGHGGRVTS